MTIPSEPAAILRIPFAGTELLFSTPEPSEHIQAAMRREQTVYEEALALDCYSRPMPRGMIIDVGANIGSHTVVFAKALGRKVLAIEPNPQALDALRVNISLNGITSRVTVLPVAAGRTSGNGRLRAAPAGNWGQASIIVDEEGPVAIVSLDGLQLKRSVALIKIDVEGMEYEVLAGAKQLLRRNRPLIYVELQTSAQYARVKRLLGRYGYRMTRRFNHTPTFLFTHCKSQRDILDALLDKTEDIARVEDLSASQRELKRTLTLQHTLLAEQSKRLDEQSAALGDQSKSIAALDPALQVHVQQAVELALAEARAAAHSATGDLLSASAKVSRDVAALAADVQSVSQRIDALEPHSRKSKFARRRTADREEPLSVTVGNCRFDVLLKNRSTETQRRPDIRGGRRAATTSRRPLADRPLQHKRQPDVAPGAATVPPEGADVVSVIMTTHNSAGFVEEAVRNVLGQSHTALELIIVDDASEDRTWQVLSALAAEDSRIRPVKMFANRGTYWCKNFALTIAKGAYVTFQDSDDRSDEHRLRLQLEELSKTDAIVCSCNYVRVDEQGSLVANRGRTERKAIMALMFRRHEVLERAGYFDSVRTSADDEFSHRLGIVFGQERICHVDKPLYFAAVREGSLTNGSRNRAETSHEDAPASDLSFLSATRREYVRQYSQWHTRLKSRLDQPRIAYPQLRRPFPAPAALISETRPASTFVTASMASMPSREPLLKQTVESILPQVDVLNVYLNNYPSTPAWLVGDKVHVIHSREYGDLRDNGKFFFLDALLPGFHFTIDDDIIYPPDYVQKCILKIETYDRRAVVGIHGVILADPFVRFMEGRKVFHFKQAACSDAFVNLLGTGTTAYHTDALELSLDDFPEPGMADVWLAIAAKRQRVPMVSIQRPQRWLVPLSEAEESSLFAAALTDDLTQTLAIKNEGSWDIRACCAESSLCRELAEKFTTDELASQGVDVAALPVPQGRTLTKDAQPRPQLSGR